MIVSNFLSNVEDGEKYESGEALQLSHTHGYGETQKPEIDRARNEESTEKKRKEEELHEDLLLNQTLKS